jgi:hypothetical protein
MNSERWRLTVNTNQPETNADDNIKVISLHKDEILKEWEQ